MGLRSSQRGVAETGFFEAAAIQVASRQVEVETIDLAKPQRAEILLPSRQRRSQLGKVTGLRLHQRIAARASSC